MIVIVNLITPAGEDRLAFQKLSSLRYYEPLTFHIMKKITILTVSLALSAGFANAAIVLQDSGFAANLDSTTITDSNLDNLDFTDASKLVLTLGVKGSGLTPDNQVGTVTYNGSPMTLAAGSGPSPTASDNA